MFRDPVSMLTRPARPTRPAAMTAPTFAAPRHALRPAPAAIALAPGADGRLLLTLTHRGRQDKLWVDARHHDRLHRVVAAARATARATAAG